MNWAKSAMRGGRSSTVRIEIAKAGRYGIEQRAEDPRPRHLEIRPECALRPPALIGNRRQGQRDRPVGEVGPITDIANAVQCDRALRAENLFFAVGAELPRGKAAAGR